LPTAYTLWPGELFLRKVYDLQAGTVEQTAPSEE
jgi:hypothetical protein